MTSLVLQVLFIMYVSFICALNIPKENIYDTMNLLDSISGGEQEIKTAVTWANTLPIKIQYNCTGHLAEDRAYTLKFNDRETLKDTEETNRTVSKNETSRSGEKVKQNISRNTFYSIRSRLKGLKPEKYPITTKPSKEETIQHEFNQHNDKIILKLPIQEEQSTSFRGSEYITATPDINVDLAIAPTPNSIVNEDTIIDVPRRSCPEGENEDLTGRCRPNFNYNFGQSGDKVT